MIRAVCFNRKFFTLEALRKICAETMGKWGGYLTDPSMVNCIESFPDGSIYFSFTEKIVNKNIYNCQDDINKFIQANIQYGLSVNKR